MDIDIQKIINAAHAGGAVLKNYFGQSLETVQKSSAADFKTKADDESEAIIVENLQRDFPEANIHSEEMGKLHNGSDYTFIIDPLDGTHNFFLGLPNFCVSIGLVHKDKIIAGVIFSPLIDQTFYAELGKGAYLEGKKLAASKEQNIERTVVSVNFSYEDGPEVKSKFIGDLLVRPVQRVINEWCCTYNFCLVGMGKIEGMIVNGSYPHDFAAGKIIAREAGCLISTFNGENEIDDLSTQFIVAGNAAILQELLVVVK